MKLLGPTMIRCITKDFIGKRSLYFTRVHV
jgi:hypothetical protein